MVKKCMSARNGPDVFRQITEVFEEDTCAEQR